MGEATLFSSTNYECNEINVNDDRSSVATAAPLVAVAVAVATSNGSPDRFGFAATRHRVSDSGGDSGGDSDSDRGAGPTSTVYLADGAAADTGYGYCDKFAMEITAVPALTYESSP
eukprot:gene2390-1742_t